jgi:tRNA G18 (ribose-2'-O)-methylase SpoU
VTKQYQISSEQNKTFRLLQSLLTSKGIRKEDQALLFGEKVVADTLKNYKSQCLGLIGSDEIKIVQNLASLTTHLVSYFLPKQLFSLLDIFGTNSPILLVQVPKFEPWGHAKGCQLVVPFQEPGNVGATLRSAAAFGVADILLTDSAAHPFHPKSSRAASGSLFLHRYFKVGRLDEVQSLAALQKSAGANLALPTIALDLEGDELSSFRFPKDFILIPGLEGSGIPKNLKSDFKIKIVMNENVESLNGPVATAIALYAFSQSKV